MKRRASLVAGALLLLTFSVGAMSGMALEEAMGLDWFDFLEEDREDSGERLLDGLGLTAQQERQAKRVLEQQEDSLEAYWEQRLPEINRMVAQSYAEIRLLLTPTQQSAFDKRLRSLGGRLPEELRDQ
jgi:Spy/CpxP family protein refolding chaperone